MLRIRLKGGALYIALIICIIVGITLSFFILIAHFNQRKILSQAALEQLRFHLISGINMAQSSFFPESENNKWKAIQEDSIRIKKLQWGAYELISVEAKNAHTSLKESGIYGIYSSKDTAIMIAEKSRPIGLGGKTKFTGNCYFPKAGIKPAFIEGESFNSESSLNSFLRPAPFQIPEVKTHLIASLKRTVSELNSNTDSIAPELPIVCRNSFSAKTLICQVGNLNLSNYSLSGNIKLISGGTIFIDATNQLNNILIIADKVVIKKGFSGNLHIIARDSIILEDECELNYPSSLTVINMQNQTNNLKGIFMGEKCIVNGAVAAINESSADPKSKVFIKLNKDCKVYGLVYSSNYAHIQGKIFGNIFCEGLLLKTPSAVYENHMLSAELDPKKHAHTLVLPLLFKTNMKLQCAKKF
jgi:hypothetical protein